MTRIEAPPCLERARSLVTPALAAASARLAPELRRVVEYHWGWLDAAGRPIEQSAGKALRPALVVLSAESQGAEAERVRAGAAAVELVHDFTLLHDDVMDDDRERRGRPAAWTCFGVGAAICAGDALALLAPRLLIEDESPHRFAALEALLAATQTVIDGQALDLAYERRTDVDPKAWAAMAERKTAALLAWSASAGALLVEGPGPAVDALAGFGRDLGLAFQAVDDWLGLWGDPARTGKPCASDLVQRKASLPIAIAMGEPGPHGDAVRAWMASDAPPEADAIARVRAHVDAVDAEARTLAFARAHHAAALEALDRAAPTPESREAFAALAAYVIGRER